MSTQQDTLSLQGRDYIALHNLLKLKGLCSSGAEAKQAIEAGKVFVDGQVELRKRCKIKVDQTIVFENHSIKIVI
ncbi:MAG: RNA-binding S4 domain-containing protein [Pseudomonadota bacterium]